MSTMMSVEEINELFRTEFVQYYNPDNGAFQLEEVSDMRATMRLVPSEQHLRPGNTISGPALMTLADVGIYCAIIAQIGPKLLSVTTHFNINFLRRPPNGDVLAKAKIIKLGKRLVVTECELISDVTNELVAHVTATYSVPPEK